ncbi:MAG: aldo/keto reductase [candidate division NC10 bacterium]|nr:aldo/keto reductase [candidate division NC10 bacterium]
MRARTLGKTGIKVGEVGFGAWAIGGPAELGGLAVGWGEVDDRDSIRALEAAFDEGINFYDTADVYGMGHSEELLARVFGKRRASVATISTSTSFTRHAPTRSTGRRSAAPRRWIAWWSRASCGRTACRSAPWSTACARSGTGSAPRSRWSTTPWSAGRRKSFCRRRRRPTTASSRESLWPRGSSRGSTPTTHGSTSGTTARA